MPEWQRDTLEHEPLELLQCGAASFSYFKHFSGQYVSFGSRMGRLGLNVGRFNRNPNLVIAFLFTPPSQIQFAWVISFVTAHFFLLRTWSSTKHDVSKQKISCRIPCPSALWIPLNQGKDRISHGGLES